MKINSRCGNCGASIPNRGKFHRCSCGDEFSRAKLSDNWKTSRLAATDSDDVREFGFPEDDADEDDNLDPYAGSCFAADGDGDYGLDADSHDE